MKKKIWHFSKKTTIWLYRFIETFVAFFLVIFSLAFWKLYTEPMDAKFMLPTLEQHLLPKDSKYSIEVEDAQLSAGFKEDGLFHLDMRGLRLIRPDKTVAINLPTVNLSYGFWHLITFNYMPDKLTIDKPDIRLVIDEEGHWRLQQGKTEEEKVKGRSTIPVKSILAHVLSFYKVAITDGVLMVEDLALKQKISVPQFELYLHRRYGGLRHIGNFKAVAQVGDHLTDVQAHATYGRITKNLKIEMAATPVYLSRFGRFWSLLEGIDFPISASLSADFNLRKGYKYITERLEKLKFQLKALSKGKLTLPSPIAATYDVKSVEINGAVSSGFKTLKIAESKAALEGETTLNLEVIVRGISEFIKKRKIEDIQTVLTAKVLNVPMADVPKVWPKEQGTNAHTWVEKHLSRGRVSEADFKLTFTGSEMTDVFGDVRVEDVAVDYLPKMPVIEKAAAQVLLYPNKVEIIVNKGHAGTVNVMNAKLLFGPFNVDPSYLDIVLDVKGPISEMLLAIDKRPLELLKGVKFDWNKIKGTAETRVHLNFPLVEERLVQELKVDVTARGKDVGVSLNNPKIKLANGKADLFVDNNGLELSGSVGFKDQPLSFGWMEDFTPSKGTTATYTVEGLINAATLQEIIPDVEEYVSGVVPVKVELKREAPDRMWQGTATLDLKDAKTILHAFSVTKEKGNPAILKLDLKQAANDFKSGKGSFDLSGKIKSEEMIAKGNVVWGNEWSLVLDEVKMPQNSFNAKLEQQKDTLSLFVKGESWNLSELKNMPFLKKEVDPEKQHTVLPPNIKFENTLNKLILNPEKPMEKVILNGERKNNLWKYFQAEAIAKDPFVIVYNPEKKVFSGEFEDLGALLSYLGASDRFSGGQLRMISKQDENGLIKGKIKVFNTELNETGFMLQAVSILGIVDAIRGKNIVFNEIQIPFEFAPEGEFKLSDAYAASSNIGMTFKGTINLDALDLWGAVIPAYAVNSLPGKIPLIGALFREGEGGGLIGVKYSVTGRPAKPEVEFHPLSSMAPGALGYIF